MFPFLHILRFCLYLYLHLFLLVLEFYPILMFVFIFTFQLCYVRAILCLWLLFVYFYGYICVGAYNNVCLLSVSSLVFWLPVFMPTIHFSVSVYFSPIYVDYLVPMSLSVCMCLWIQIWVSGHLLSCMWSTLLCCCHQLTSHNSCTVVQVQTQCQSTYRSTVGTRPWAHTVGPSCPPNSCPTVTPWRLSSAHADPRWLSPDFSPTTSLSQVMLDKSFSFLTQINKKLKTD